MATIGGDNPTLVDVLKYLDPKGAPARVIEKLRKVTPILDFMTSIEGNLPTGHQIASDLALPSLGWKLANSGVPPSKGRRGTVDESAGILAGYSVIDRDVAATNGNEAAYRADEDRVFMQAMQQEVASGLFYHSTSVAAEKFHGILPRLDALSDDQVIAGDASPVGSDQASIVLAVFAPDTVTSFFPKGTRGGIFHEDMDVQLVDDGAGGKYSAWVTEWKWKVGLAVPDKRYLAAARNIDISNLSIDLTSGADLPDIMTQLFGMVRSTNAGRAAYFMPRTVLTMFNRQLQYRESRSLDWAEKYGRLLPTWLGVPILWEESLTTTEAIVS